MLEKKDFFLEDLKHDSTIVGGWCETVRENLLRLYEHTERSVKSSIISRNRLCFNTCEYAFSVVGLRSHAKH